MLAGNDGSWMTIRARMGGFVKTTLHGNVKQSVLPGRRLEAFFRFGSEQ